MERTLDPSPEAVAHIRTRRVDTRGLTLRAFTARGVIVNALFDFGLSGLTLVRGFVLAALLTRSDYGVWGVLAVTLGLLSHLKFVGIADKYIQQEERDQELAFQKAFTFEVLATALAALPLVAALPVIALVYGHWNLVAPGAVLISVMAAGALQAPFWVYYRDMNFVRQRLLGLVEPIVGFVVAVVLAALGVGYWALVIGLTAGAWCGAAVALIRSPYRLRWRYDRASLRVYASFSGPLFIATACNVILGNAAAIVANIHLGLAGVGAIALASNVTAFTTRVDDLVSGTLYPAICAIQHRLDLLRESFAKSNRLALMWAMPFGIGLALFGSDLVQFGLGAKWRPATTLIEITGVVAAISQIGFNWDDYFRARSDTRPVGVAAVAATVTFLGVGVPLLFADGLVGLAIGIGAQAAVHLAFRIWYLSRLFTGFRFGRHAVLAMFPTAVGAVVVLLARQLESGPRSLAMAMAELGMFVIVTAASTWVLEGKLLREAVGYVFAKAERPAPSTG